jgi:hypothetical protein
MALLQQGSCFRATHESYTAQTRTLTPALMPYQTLTTVWRLLITRVWAGGSGQLALFELAEFFAPASMA